MKIFLYGPSGYWQEHFGTPSGGGPGLPFVDLDEKIEAQAGQSIPEIFRQRANPASGNGKSGRWARS